MEMKPVMVAIAAFVVITVIAAVLMPVLGDATKTEDTFTNEGVRMSALGNQTLTISTDGSKWTIGDRTIEYTNTPITQGTVMIYGVNTPNTRCGYLYVLKEDQYSRNEISRSTTNTYEYVGSTKTVNITSIVGGVTYTATYAYVGEIYYNDPAGDYVWNSNKPSTAYYAPSEWTLFNTWSDGTANNFYAVIEGKAYHNSNVAIDDATTTLVTEDVTGHIGIKTIQSYELNLSGEDPVTCRGYILPYQITAERTNHLDANEITLLMTIPVLLIVAIIIGILAIAIRMRE